MGWLQAAAVLATIIGLWIRATTVMAAQGRGWLFRNWIGGTIAGFVSLVVLVMVTADKDFVNLLGFVVAVGAAYAPWWKMPDTAAKTAPPSTAPD